MSSCARILHPTMVSCNPNSIALSEAVVLSDALGCGGELRHHSVAGSIATVVERGVMLWGVCWCVGGFTVAIARTGDASEQL